MADDPLSLLSDIESLGAEAPLSMGEKVIGYGRSFASGPLLNYADNLESLLASVMSGNSADNELTRIRSEQDRFKRNTDYTDNALEIGASFLNPLSALSKVKAITSAPGIGLLSKVMTSVPSQAAIAGAGAADGQDVLENAAGSAALGTGLSALSSVIGKTVGNTAREANRLKLSAYGIGAADVNRQLKKMGDDVVSLGYADDIPIVQTLAKVEKEGLVEAGNDIITNAKNLHAKQGILGSNLSTLLGEADAVVTPKMDFGLDNTIKYIEQFSGKAKLQASKAAADEFDALVSQMKTGSIAELQDLKRGLNYKWDENPYADDVIKALRKDIKTEIEKRVDDAASNGLIKPSYAGKVKKLNSEWGELADLKDTFLKRAGKDLQGDMVEDVFMAGRTSGGAGSAINAAAATGNPIYAGLGALATAARVPEAKSAIADVLRDPVWGGVVKGAANTLPEVVTGRSVAQAKGVLQEDNSLKEAPASKQDLDSILSEIESLAGGQPGDMAPIKDTFISKEEGGQRLKAYPPPGKGSGVTVATGVDLGQRSRQELEDLGVSTKVISKVAPYLNKKDSVAREMLKEKPLNLTKDEADELDSAIEKDIYGTLETKLKADGVDLNSLPAEAQTVVKSLAWNFGKNLDKKLPTLWGAIISEDWEEVQRLLTSTKWKQPELRARRNREADLLKAIV